MRITVNPGKSPGLKTACKLRKRLKRLGIRYNRIASDEWDSFLTAFKEDELLIGKKIR